MSLRIIDQTAPHRTTTTLNNIPDGQVFRGTILDRRERPYQGTYMKLCGPITFSVTKDATTGNHITLDVVVVSLDKNGWFWPWCREVIDYEPLIGELSLKGAK